MRRWLEATLRRSTRLPTNGRLLQAARPAGHRAIVFGRSVWLEPDTKISRLPFDWGTVIGPQFDPVPDNAPIHTMPEASVSIRARGSSLAPTGVSRRPRARSPLTRNKAEARGDTCAPCAQPGAVKQLTCADLAEPAIIVKFQSLLVDVSSGAVEAYAVHEPDTEV